MDRKGDVRYIQTIVSTAPVAYLGEPDGCRHRQTTLATARIISADCHVNEPPHVFDGVPADAQGPRAEDAARRRRRRRLELRRRDRPSAASASRRPRAASRPTRRCRACAFDEILPGNYDGKAHVADMAARTASTSRSSTPTTRSSPTSSPTASSRSRACARTTTGCSTSSRARRPTTSSACRCCRSTTASTSASPSSTAAVAKGARAGFIPGFPIQPYHYAVLRPALRRAAEAGHTAHVPPHVRRQAVARPTGTSWSTRRSPTAGTVYRFFAAVRPFTYMVFGGVFDRHPALRSSRPRSTAAGCRSGRRRWSRTSTSAAGMVDDDSIDQRSPDRAARDATCSSPCSTTTWASS